MGSSRRASCTTLALGVVSPYDEELAPDLAKKLVGYGGIIKRLADALDKDSPISFRPLESFVLPSPWQKGCVLPIGDASHPTTPQFAADPQASQSALSFRRFRYVPGGWPPLER